MPVAKSISRFPSTSSTIAPAARAVTIGWRFATPRGTAASRRCEPFARPWPRDLGDELPLLRDVHDQVLRSPASIGCVAPRCPGVSCGSRPACQPADVPKHGKDPEARVGRRPDTWPRMPSDSSSSLDFWLGEWSCTWEGGRGRNGITKEMDGHVVVERFESLEPELWSGLSVSVFDATQRMASDMGRLDGQLLGTPRVAQRRGILLLRGRDRGRPRGSRSGWSSRGSRRTRSTGDGSGRRTAASRGSSCGPSTTTAPMMRDRQKKEGKEPQERQGTGTARQELASSRHGRGS